MVNTDEIGRSRVKRSGKKEFFLLGAILLVIILLFSLAYYMCRFYHAADEIQVLNDPQSVGIEVSGEGDIGMSFSLELSGTADGTAKKGEQATDAGK